MKWQFFFSRRSRRPNPEFRSNEMALDYTGVVARSCELPIFVSLWPVHVVWLRKRIPQYSENLHQRSGLWFCRLTHCAGVLPKLPLGRASMVPAILHPTIE